MKKTTIIFSVALLLTGLVITTGCHDNSEPGRTYMPDMVYSRAIETYSELDSSFTMDSAYYGEKIFYTFKTVPGSIKRGELFPFTIPNDSAGYEAAAAVKNPLPPLTPADSIEAGRLFNINCAICHGADGKADGPIADKIGAVANLTSATYVALPDGKMFYTIN